MEEEGGKEEGEGVCCVCFSDFVSEGKNDSLFSFLTQMERFVLISCRILTFNLNTYVHIFYYNIQYKKLNIT